jgi:hypothetical protein
MGLLILPPLLLPCVAAAVAGLARHGPPHMSVESAEARSVTPAAPSHVWRGGDGGCPVWGVSEVMLTAD